MYAATQNRYHFLHDAEVIQGGHQRGKEDNHWQQLKCDRKSPLLPGQFAEHELAAYPAVIDHVLYACHHGVEEGLSRREV